MRIYRNDTSINMSLDEFLDILDSDLFEDLLFMLTALDEQEDAFLLAVQDYLIEELGGLDGFVEGEFDEEEFYTILRGLSDEEIEFAEMEIDQDWIDEDPFEDIPLSQEDQRVIRIVERYGRFAP